MILIPNMPKNHEVLESIPKAFLSRMFSRPCRLDTSTSANMLWVTRRASRTAAARLGGAPTKTVGGGGGGAGFSSARRRADGFAARRTALLVFL